MRNNGEDMTEPKIEQSFADVILNILKAKQGKANYQDQKAETVTDDIKTVVG